MVNPAINEIATIGVKIRSVDERLRVLLTEPRLAVLIQVW